MHSGRAFSNSKPTTRNSIPSLLSQTNSAMNRPCLLAALLIAIIGANVSFSQVPTTMAYQGVLTDASDVPVPDGSYSVTLGLFTAASGGSASYAETHTVSTSGGVFSAELGAGTPVSGTWDGLDFTDGYWLETEVAGTTLSPRTRLLSSPYARTLAVPAIVRGSVSNGVVATVINDATSGYGDGLYAFGADIGSTWGILGSTSSPEGTGVYGAATSTLGIADGVVGQTNSPDGRGVWGIGPTYGVYGVATASTLSTYGVVGRASSDQGIGVDAEAPLIGVDARSTATTGTGYGVRGTSSAELGAGVEGVSTSNDGAGVSGRAPEVGVAATSAATSGSGWGVFAFSNAPGGAAVLGRAQSTTGAASGVYGQSDSPTGYGGYFQGRVNVTGTLTKGGGAFQIDHPLDPENRILRHSFVESPDMMNVYNGNITTDGRGYATVELPTWFEALNRDFRYQLTTMRSFSRAMIAEGISDGRFVIRTEEPNVEVSWQVTGIRQDAWANENRIVVEEDKNSDDRGRYLHPAAFGLPRELGADYDAEQEARLLERPAPMLIDREHERLEPARLDFDRPVPGRTLPARRPPESRRDN